MRTIAVIFGSRSAEHDVSVVTALSSIIKPLELTGNYRVEPIYIAKNGAWYWDQKLKDIHLFQSGEIDEFMRKAPRAHVHFDGGFTLVKSSQFAGRKQYQKIDIVFPATHGTYGEDGALMGLLEMANVPYVGCGVAASAIAMDKVLAKQVTSTAGIRSTPWTWAYSHDFARDPRIVRSLVRSLRYPLFVKPAHLGSSIGISKVEEEKELLNALEVAAHYDDKVIIEQGVQNLIEVTLPIIGNNEPRPALLEQPLTKPEDFFDFDSKYMHGGKKGGAKEGRVHGYSNLPADLEPDLVAKACEIGLNVYKAVGCEGIARVDMLIDGETREVLFNELNPLPGSLYAHNWRQAGVSSIELVTTLVNLAEERYERKTKLTTSFTTNYLKQF